MNKYLAEFLGMFFWVLTIGCVSIGAAAGTIPAVGIGIVVAVMVALMWNVSGANFSPAVSLAMWRGGWLSSKELAPYIVFQFLGAAGGAATVKILKKGLRAATMQPHEMPAFGTEFVFGLLLCYAAVHLQLQREKASRYTAGAMIGGIVTAGIFALGPVSGGLLNPAAAFGSAIAGLLSFKTLWVYLLAHGMAGLIAPYAYRRLNPEKQTGR